MNMSSALGRGGRPLSPPPPLAIDISPLHGPGCEVDGNLVGLGVRLGVYGVAVGYFCLIRRLRRNESHFTIMRRLIHAGDCASAISAIMLVTLLAKRFKGAHAAEFLVYAHLSAICGAVTAHSRMISWMTEPSRNARSCYEALKRNGTLLKDVLQTAQYIAVYVLMWCGPHSNAGTPRGGCLRLASQVCVAWCTCSRGMLAWMSCSERHVSRSA